MGHLIRKSCKFTGFRIEKNEQGEERLVIGLASTFEPPERADSMNEILERGAFARSIEEHETILAETGRRTIKLLWQHSQPLGYPMELRETEKGLEIVAYISKTSLGNDVIQLLRDGAVDAFSIGFFPNRYEVDEEHLDQWGWPLVKHLDVDLVEVSIVTFPANPYALISDVKMKHRRQGMGDPRVLRNGLLQRSTKGLVPFEAWPLAPLDTEFDADAERAAATVDDLEDMAVYFDDDAADDPDSYWGLHHRASDLWTVFAGVMQAMAWLLVTEPSDDFSEAIRADSYTHLSEHYAEFDRMAPDLGVWVADDLDDLEAEFPDEVAHARMILETRSDAGGPSSKAAIEFQDLPIVEDTSQLYNARDEPDSLIINAILGTADDEEAEPDWDRLRSAYVWEDPERDPENPTREDFKLKIARMYDPDDPDNVNPASGELRVFFTQLASRMAILNGAREGVDIPDEDRQAVYDVMVRYYEKFDREPPELLALDSADGKGCEGGFCTVGEKGIKGEALSGILNAAIEEALADDEEISRGDIVAALADAAGISSGTVNEILSGEINCPPEQRLEGFAEILGVSMSTLIDAAIEDGCDPGLYGRESSKSSSGALADLLELCADVITRQKHIILDDPNGTLCVQLAKRAGYVDVDQLATRARRAGRLRRKAGRVLSQSNVDALTRAIERIGEGIENIKGVLESASVDEDSKGAVDPEIKKYSDWLDERLAGDDETNDETWCDDMDVIAQLEKMAGDLSGLLQ